MALCMTEELKESLKCWRRTLHSRPEIGWCEFWTTAWVAEELQFMGYSPKVGQEFMTADKRMGLPAPSLMQEARRASQETIDGVPGATQELLGRMGGYTGIVLDIIPEGKRQIRPGIVLRCDMDALPIAEMAAAPHRPFLQGFISKNKNNSHSCGHDGHMAIALGCAALLAPLKNSLQKSVRIVFQPAEEGVRGAEALKEQVQGFPLFLGYHIGLSCKETGTLVTGVSDTFATTKFDVDFKGREAHAAQAPQEGNDALKAACETVLALHALPRDSRGEGRINVGICRSGKSRNIVPGQAHLECEVRGRPSCVNETLYLGAKRIVAATAAMNGLLYHIKMTGHAESAESDDTLAKELADLAAKAEGHFTPLFSKIIMRGTADVSEDAATLMNVVQNAGGRACYMLFGSHLASGHHTFNFDFEEKILAPASLFLAKVAWHFCGGKNSTDSC